ncbi:MAG: BspA family leucine-rich repeat surface protein, partial [Bacteroidales bacterium]|nr:BspA family leucine-rich repeat surface protein [Bacteroidales bacterium]
MNYNPINSSHRSLGWVKFSFVLFLWIFVGFVNKAVGQEAYAEVSVDGKTLTFYYDGQRANHVGMVYGMNTGEDKPGWYTYRSSITKVVFTEAFKDARPTSCYDWFFEFYNLTSIIGLEYLNTSKVSNMTSMFSGCSNLIALDVTKFNTENVTSMWSMFLDCHKLTTLDVTNFNTHKVSAMNFMFFGCNNLIALDLTNFNTKNVIYMNGMFSGCSNLTKIIVGLTWQTTNVTNGGYMFEDCSLLEGEKGTQYTDSKIDQEYAHVDGGASNPGYLTAGVAAYAVVSTDKTTLSFYYDDQWSSREGTVYGMNTGDDRPGWVDGTYPSNPNYTKVIFDASFAAARPTSCYEWFAGFENLTTITGLEYLNTSEVTNMSRMFLECSSLTTLDLTNCNTANVTEMVEMFFGCANLISLDVTNFNTENVIVMYRMFTACRSLNTLDVTKFNTANVMHMGFMFANCNSLNTLDLTNFNTAKVADMRYMFYYCESLTTLDLTSFNTSKVEDMEYMFSRCSHLTTLLVDESNWKTDKVTSSSEMFEFCYGLIGNKGTTYNSSKIDVEYAHIDEGVSNPGYLTTGKYKIFYNGIDDDDATLDTYTGAVTEFMNEEVTLVEPKKDGYEFIGWTGTIITGLTTTPSKTVTIAKGEVGNRIYTAHWKAKVTLSVAINGWIYGSTPSTPIVKKNNTEISLSDVVLKYTDENNQEITPSSTTPVGTYTITATYPESATELSATASTTFTISPLVINLNDPNIASLLSIVLNPDSYIYDGKAKEPAVTITFNGLEVPAAEYTVSYQDNINAGTAKAIITDNQGGNYTINGTAPFTITPGIIHITAANVDENGVIIADASNEYFCKGKAVIDFTVQNGTLDNYSIEFDGGEISSQNGAITGNSIEFALPKGLLPGTYNGFMELTSNDGNSTGKLPIRVIINLPFYTIVTLYNDVAAVNQLAGEFSAYKWTENGSEISGANGRILQHTLNKSSVYTAILTKTDGGSYETCPLDLSRISVGNSTARLVVYPNPAIQGNDITVEVSENYNPEANKQIYIYNLNGTLAKHLSSPQEINKVQLPTGNYS